MRTKTKDLAWKIEIAKLALDRLSVPALVNELFPVQTTSEEVRNKMQQNIYHWSRGFETHRPEIVEHLRDALDINVHVGVAFLMKCSAREFFLKLPDDHRSRVSASATRELENVIAHEPIGDAANNEPVKIGQHRHAQANVSAGLKLMSGFVHSASPAYAPNTPRSWPTACWELCLAIHTFVEDIKGNPEVVVMVVGPAIQQGSPNFDRPVFLAATGHTMTPLDGEHAHMLSQFMDAASHLFPQPPSQVPPDGEHVRPTKGLLLQAWHPAETFPNELVESYEFADHLGDYFHFPRKSIQDRRDMYLEVSKATEAVYLFRVAGRTSEVRLVVAMDFLGECSLGKHQCSFVMEAIHSALIELAGASATAP